MERIVSVERNTAETQISLTLNLDGTGRCTVACPVGFLLHMLQSFCKHGLFDLSGSIQGDINVDQHHLIEDTGITLGMAFDQALKTRAGITRAGFFLFPMDETLAQAAVDFGGRAYCICNAQLSDIPLVGGCPAGSAAAVTTFQTACFEDFWQGFAGAAKCNLHLDIIRGRSDHHKMEGLFKAASRALRQAVTVDARLGGTIPSTKQIIC